MIQISPVGLVRFLRANGFRDFKQAKVLANDLAFLCQRDPQRLAAFLGTQDVLMEPITKICWMGDHPRSLPVEPGEVLLSNFGAFPSEPS